MKSFGDTNSTRETGEVIDSTSGTGDGTGERSTGQDDEAGEEVFEIQDDDQE